MGSLPYSFLRASAKRGDVITKSTLLLGSFESNRSASIWKTAPFAVLYAGERPDRLTSSIQLRSRWKLARVKIMESPRAGSALVLAIHLCTVRDVFGQALVKYARKRECSSSVAAMADQDWRRCRSNLGRTSRVSDDLGKVCRGSGRPYRGPLPSREWKDEGAKKPSSQVEFRPPLPRPRFAEARLC
jgi:hypothetical protein